MRRLSFAFLAFILLGSSQVAGQQIRKGGWGPGLGPFRILDTWHATFGGDARRVFSKYGMTLGSNGAGVRLVSHPVVGPGIMPRPAPPRIRNLPPQGSQADLPLVIDFRFPVRGLAFVFFGDPKGTTATVSGFNAEGVFLGKLEYDVSYFAGTDVEMEALAPEGISKLVVKFEGHQTEEEIGGEWAVKFVDPPLFTTVLPQIGDGLLDDGRSLSTRFTILNSPIPAAQGKCAFTTRSATPWLSPSAPRLRA